MQYRREIDGLRAIAVIPVILFHARFKTFSGGFVGVDVFFVISGYLITGLILKDLEDRRFSILQFYERRARRILPALFFVMASCVPFAMMWMTSQQFVNFTQSLAAVSVFSSNILFWRESGYFANAVDLKPLLHTWSLAVEEQYYMLFPIFLILLWRCGRATVVRAIAAVAVASFFLSEWGWRNEPIANFYLAPSRAWELMAGALCAFTRWPGQSRVNDPLAAIGLMLILLAVFAYSEATPFPSAYALVPVVGTAFIILFASSETWVARLLSTPPFVGIGLISYSAYLWHQPLFAFARARSMLTPAPWLMAALAAASLALAYVSWRFVERPFRARPPHRLWTRDTIFKVSGAVAASFIAAGFLGEFAILRPAIVKPPNIEFDNMRDKINKVGEICDRTPDDRYPGVKSCVFGDASANSIIALYGDSHARAISYNLADLFRQHGLRGLYVAIDGCEVVPTIARRNAALAPHCRPAFANLAKMIAERTDGIVVASRWTFRLYPVAGHINRLDIDNGEGGVEQNEYREAVVVGDDGRRDLSAAGKRAAVTNFVSALTATGKPVFLVYPIPETGWNISKINYYDYNYNKIITNELTVSSSLYDKRNAFIIDIFDDISANNLFKIKPRNLFCDTYIKGRCVAQMDYIPLYYDDDHLSYVGSQRLNEVIVANILASLNSSASTPPAQAAR